MSIGPMGGIVGSAAGAPLSQTKGSEVEKTQQDTSNQQRKTDNDAAAELASGIGHTEEDQQATERDADGRRLWEVDKKDSGAANDEQAEQFESPSSRQSKDTTGQSGHSLDLTG